MWLGASPSGQPTMPDSQTLHLLQPDGQDIGMYCKLKRKERKDKKKATPFGINVVSSLVMCQAAQARKLTIFKDLTYCSCW